MQFKLLCLLVIGLSIPIASNAQLNTKNPDGSYNPYAYKEWKGSEDIKNFERNTSDAFSNSNSSSFSKNTKPLAELYEPKQSAEDAAKNNSCISGNCLNGIGTYQGTPTTMYRYVGRGFIRSEYSYPSGMEPGQN